MSMFGEENYEIDEIYQLALGHLKKFGESDFSGCLDRLSAAINCAIVASKE